MLLFENTIKIRADKDQVFRFASNPLNLPKWNYFVQRVDQLSGDGPADGARYRQVRRNDEQQLRIDTFTPGKTLMLYATGGDIQSLERTLSFSQAPDGTKIVDDWKLSTRYNGIAERVFGRKIRDAVHENLRKLKRLLETGEVTLQDGRTTQLGRQ